MIHFKLNRMNNVLKLKIKINKIIEFLSYEPPNKRAKFIVIKFMKQDNFSI
jgi:hypothetical protein